MGHIPEISEIRFEIARCVCRFFLYILKLEHVERHCDISQNIVRFDMNINEKYIVIRRTIYYEVSEDSSNLSLVFIIRRLKKRRV